MITVERIETGALSPSATRAIRQLCDAAYMMDTAQYFLALGAGTHLLGWQGIELVSHLMWVTRWLQPGDGGLLQTAYVEMVATAPIAQRRGYATALLERFVSEVSGFDIAALSPATENLYARLGWTFWRGPLAARTDAGLEMTPVDTVMVMPLPRTPRLDYDLPLSIEWRPGEIW